MPQRLAAHSRQGELAHPDEPEHVRLELAAHHVERNVLDRARLAVAGVVDEHSDRALGLLHRADRGRIEASSVTSSASMRQPFSCRSAIDSGRRAVA